MHFGAAPSDACRSLFSLLSCARRKRHCNRCALQRIRFVGAFECAALIEYHLQEGQRHFTVGLLPGDLLGTDDDCSRSCFKHVYHDRVAARINGVLSRSGSTHGNVERGGIIRVKNRRFSAEGHSSAAPTGQRPCPSDPQTRIPAGCGDHRRGTTRIPSHPRSGSRPG